MSTVNVSTVVSAAVAKLTDGYDLDEEFVTSLRTNLESVLKKYYIYDSPQNVAPAASDETTEKKSKKKVATKKTSSGGEATAITSAEPPVEEVEKKPRKPSAYNIFVKEKMSDFKDESHKDRMGKVAALWKSLSDEDKAAFKVKADAASA